MITASVIVTYFLLHVFLTSPCTAKECKKLNSCSCSFEDGTVVDLSPVARTDGLPRFRNITTKDSPYKYSYNPCQPFTTSGCKDTNTAVCQYDGGTVFYTTGLHDKVSFSVSPTGQLIATYLSNTTRHTLITLACRKNSEDELVVWGETEPSTYNMTLYSRCACPDGCVGKSPNEGLSTGSILVIFFFVVLCCYLLGGILFQKIVKGAEGRETIPHYDFWIDFPLLVRDGVVFVLNGCKTEASYERI